ncbi:hypothetical protein [Mesorhizobium sp. YM1C-6-2]|uniref:hypothetical protein n=1 Tax=Mesorhizobium sp. YM1C-6-2 TaxID=1827501 RepID=UPI000EF23EA1|nr:hypothetical protein [Mesorhizobium sp. YM1C-6-2]RLP21995.1 hypothetical protein D8676_26390 [Mesorhizobium sp. YM1C-6-2]
MLNTLSTPSLHDKFLAAWSLPNPARFEVGDEIEFEKSDGWRWIITILGRAEDGEFECMSYDGQPHFLTTDEETLAALRITQRGRMDEETIAMYRDLLGLD